MSRARDLANLGDQAGSGFDASDLTTGTLGNTVQDNITRLGTVTSGTFNGTIGSSASFPDGIIVDRQYYKYELASNSSYDISTGNVTIITRTSGSDQTVQNITIEPEYTYIYEFQIYQEIFRVSNTVSNRFFDCSICEGTTDRNQGDTSTDTALALGRQGRLLASGTSNFATSYGLYQYKGAIYYGSGATTNRYVYLKANSNDGDKILRSYFSTNYPCYLFITKIKGNKATDVT